MASVPSSSLPRLLIGAGAIVMALLLIVLAIPRTTAAIELARYKPVYDRLQSGDTGVDDATLAASIAGLTRAFGQTKEPQYGNMVAYLHMVSADRAQDRTLAEARLVQAADAARATIRSSPSNLIAWIQLAMALDSRDPRDPATLAALARSIHIAPYDPRMLGFRIALAMRHWSRSGRSQPQDGRRPDPPHRRAEHPLPRRSDARLLRPARRQRRDEGSSRVEGPVRRRLSGAAAIKKAADRSAAFFEIEARR